MTGGLLPGGVYCAFSAGGVVWPAPYEHQQEDWSCGAAALRSALALLLKKDVPEPTLRRQLGTDPEDGTDPGALARVARDYGLTATPYYLLTLGRLRELLARGPVLVCVQAHGWPEEYARDEAGHYSLVIGEAPGRVILEDPSGEGGRLRVPDAVFVRQWHDKSGKGVHYRRYGLLLEAPARFAEELPEPRDPLAAAHRQTAAAVADIAESLARRLLRGEPATLTDEERANLVDALALAVAVGDLSGRARVRKKLAEAQGEAFAEGWESFEEARHPLTPDAALKFFRGLVPTLSRDPHFDQDMRRRAFTLAVATEQTLVEHVQQVIGRALEAGTTATAQHEVQALLDEAGLTLRNPTYAEMCTRTNVKDAAAEGWQDEMDGLQDEFPVWRYSNPHDSRSRPDHYARNGLYYPASVRFGDVRGNDIGDKANCRCDPVEIHRLEWRRLRAAGHQIARGYVDPLAHEDATVRQPIGKVKEVVEPGEQSLVRARLNPVPPTSLPTPQAGPTPAPAPVFAPAATGGVPESVQEAPEMPAETPVAQPEPFVWHAPTAALAGRLLGLVADLDAGEWWDADALYHAAHQPPADDFERALALLVRKGLVRVEGQWDERRVGPG